MKSLLNQLTLLFSLTLLTIACNNHSEEQDNPKMYDSNNVPIEEPHIHGTDTVDVYSNERFKNVWAEKLSDTSYRITGQAQVFEAAFSWVLSDGESELLTGNETTDAGAPEFGHFSFTLTVPKKDAGDNLHLVLFEVSAKDGSRQFELPVILP